MIDDVDSAALPKDVVIQLRRLIDELREPPEPLLRLSARHLSPEDVLEDSQSDAFQDVTMWLYQSWYCLDQDPGSNATPPGRSVLSSAFRVAVADAARWETGWVAMQCSPDGACIAGHRDHRRSLLPGQYANSARPGLAPQPGDGLAVNALLDWTDPQTGFWHMQSSRGEPSHPLARVYWNTTLCDVGYVLNALTTALDGMEIRYALKCPLRAEELTRVDSLVVYVEHDQWTTIEPMILQVAASLENRLRRSIPPLTLRLADGVAWAEDPGNGQSFGDSRCRALAPGVLALLRTREQWTDDHALALLIEALRDAGIDPLRPWISSSVQS